MALGVHRISSNYSGEHYTCMDSSMNPFFEAAENIGETMDDVHHVLGIRKCRHCKAPLNTPHFRTCEASAYEQHVSYRFCTKRWWEKEVTSTTAITSIFLFGVIGGAFIVFVIGLIVGGN